jgi:hypothetical protein
VLTIADREADFYDLFAAARRPGHDLLIRARARRRVCHEAGLLGAAVRATPAARQLTVTLRRGDDRPERQATLTLRFGQVLLKPPSTHPRRKELAPLPVWAVLAQEDEPPPGHKPVCWLLLTTVPVRAADDAVQAVLRYAQRWLVERLHYVLKTGCRVEQLQLETADRLLRAVATYTVVAWRLLWLAYEARHSPAATCAVAFDRLEWEVLHRAVHAGAPVPAAAPSLAEAVEHVARLGGFLARRGDGAPGVTTLWRGLRRLHDLVAGYRLTLPHQATPPDTYG